MKTRPNIDGIIPELYREEYPALVDFVNAYYQFLQSKTFTGSILGIRDIDTTLDLFSDQLRKELLASFPVQSTLDQRELLRNAKALYNVKGTESSYRFLFRALFGSDVEIFYPSSVILKTSDGRWEQDTELQVRFTSGDPNHIIGNRVVIGQSTPVFVNRIKLISGNDYVIIVDKNSIGVVSIGDILSFNGVIGTVLPVLSKANIINPGLGFTSGRILDIPGGNGTGAKIRVSSVNSDGSLRKVELVKFGSGYNSNFTQTIGTASIHFTVGAIAKYPGYFSSSNGFLSDAMRLQDNEYYQIYSYVLKLDTTIDRYRSIVKSLLHPVGWALFGDFEITNNFNLSLAIKEISHRLIQLLWDVVSTEDNILTIGTNKVLNTDVSTLSSHISNFTSQRNSTVVSSSNGSIFIEFAGDYATEYFSERYTMRETPEDYATEYFSEIGTNRYTVGDLSQIRTW